jgi:hypothetical protein
VSGFFDVAELVPDHPADIELEDDGDDEEDGPPSCSDIASPKAAAGRSFVGSALPAEQARILQLLVARVTVRLDGLEISLRVEGITTVIEDLRLRASTERQAA